MSTDTVITAETERLVHELLVAERAAKRAAEKAAQIKAELVERLGVKGTYDGPEAKVSIVQSTSRVVDVDALQAVASKGFFYKVTKRVVDTAAFKALDSLGQVPAEVQEIVQEKVSAPYVKVTVKV